VVQECRELRGEQRGSWQAEAAADPSHNEHVANREPPPDAADAAKADGAQLTRLREPNSLTH
jgi:hypothetical protein